MNYHKIYESLIERAKLRKLSCYRERHHIIPRCLGGNDDSDNIVDLTPEEHYVAHQLLVKMYPNSPPLAQAAMMMTAQRPSNKVYGWLRKRHRDAMSQSQAGTGNSQFGTRWIYSLELRETKKIPKNAPTPPGWQNGRRIKWDISKCKHCNTEFTPVTKEQYCTDACRVNERNSRVDYYGREEELKQLYLELGSMNKALKAMGYPGAMSHWYSWAKRVLK